MRAFFRTVMQVTRGRVSMRDEAALPHRFADANRFRWVVCWIAGAWGLVLSIIAAVVVAVVLRNFTLMPPIFAGEPQIRPEWYDLVLPLLAALVSGLVYPICLLVFALCATGVPLFLYGSASGDVTPRVRGMALSNYASAVIIPQAVLTTLAAGAIGFEVATLQDQEFNWLPVTGAAVLMLGLLPVYAVRLARVWQLTVGGGRSMLRPLVVIVSGWVVLGVVLLVALPWSLGLLAIMLLSITG